MERKSFAAMNCSVAQCLEVVGEWWSVLLIRDALLGVTKFDDFWRRLGISKNILASRLNHLIDRGVMYKSQYSTKPERYEYLLTDKGRDLWTVISAMREWGDRYEAPNGPPVEVQHRTCGHVTNMIAVCSHCGERLESRDLKMVSGPGATEPGFLPKEATAKLA